MASPSRPSIVLYQFPPYPGLESVSPRCVKVHLVLRCKRLAYSTQNLTRIAERRRLHHSGKLPVIRYDGELVAESGEIARFLEARHPRPSLIPEEPRQRMSCELYEDWVDNHLYHFWAYQIARHYDEALLPVYFPRWPSLARPLLRRAHRGLAVMAGAVWGLGRYPPETVDEWLCRRLDGLAAQIGDGFLLGETLTLADLCVYTALQKMLAGGTPEPARRIRERSVLTAWMQRIEAATTAGEDA